MGQSRRAIWIWLSVAAISLLGVTIYFANEWWPGCDTEWLKKVHPDEPLMVAAAEEGCSGCIRTLLRSGQNPNLGSNAGYTPLSAAAAYGHYSTVHLLIRSGAQVNDGKARTAPLCQALMTRYDTGRVTKLLLDSHAPLEWAGDERPFTVFDCLNHDNGGPGEEIEVRRFRFLIRHGLADLFNRLPESRQATVILSLYDDEIRQLGEQGAKFNLDVRDESNKSILARVAATPSLCGRVRLLIGEGARYSQGEAEAVNRCNQSR